MAVKFIANQLTAGRSFFGSLLTTAAYEASIASSISSSGIAPPIREAIPAGTPYIRLRASVAGVPQ